ETLVVEMVKANYGKCEVIHVGRPGDEGIDILFIDDGGRQWIIQVKRRQDAGAPEGIATLRNLLGAMVIHDTKYGVLVSTADHFTIAVKKAKKKVAPRGYRLTGLPKVL